MDNISLIPKDRKELGLPKFGSFKAPKIEVSALGKIGLFIILFTVLLAGGFYGWKYVLDNNLKKLNTELQQITGQRDVSLENRLQNLNNVLEVFKTVLNDHSYWSLFFKILEERTLNTITFKSLEGDGLGYSISMDGVAPSYSSLAQQIKIFEDTPGIVSVEASGISLDESGKIKFGLKIIFNKEIIRKK